MISEVVTRKFHLGQLVWGRQEVQLGGGYVLVGLAQVSSVLGIVVFLSRNASVRKNVKRQTVWWVLK